MAGALAAAVVLALVSAAIHPAKQDRTSPERNEGPSSPPVLLRYKTVRSILEDSKGNTLHHGGWPE